jgi:hypothetical protein
VGKGVNDVIAKQSAAQKSVVVKMLAFYVIKYFISVCHVAISRIIIDFINNNFCMAK